MRITVGCTDVGLVGLNYWGMEKSTDGAKVVSKLRFEVGTKYPVGGDPRKAIFQLLLTHDLPEHKIILYVVP